MTDGKLAFSRLWVLMVTAFVDMIGFALILPLLPYYATRFGASPFIVGILMASFAFAQLVTAPLWGRVSDHAGRRPIILAGQCLSALAFVSFAFAETVWLLLLCRFLQGAGGGAIAATTAYVSDSVGPEERAKALGWITACTSAGVMIGPAIASFSVGFSYKAPGLIAASLCVLNFIFAWRWLPESATAERRSQKRRPLGQAIWSVIQNPAARVSTLIWIYTAGMMAFMAMNAVMALYLAERFGITEQTIGWFYFTVGAVSVVIRGFVLGIVVRHFGEVKVLRLGALTLAFGMGIAPIARSPLEFLVAILLIPTGTAFLFPSTTSLISRYSDASEVGQMMGVQQGFGGMSRLIGPLWAGAIYQEVSFGAPFAVGSALVAFTALFAFLRLRPGEAQKPARASKE